MVIKHQAESWALQIQWWAAELPAPLLVELQGLGEQHVREEKLVWPERRDGGEHQQ